MTENSPLLTSKKGKESNALDKLEQYLTDKQCSVCCYNIRPLSNAEIVRIQEMPAYVLRLWTLIENRWTTEDIAPYHGDEICPSQSVGDIWRDYQFSPPNETILSNPKVQYADRHLLDSQRKEPCTKCDCQGRIQCETCHGYGHLKCLACQEQGQIVCCRDMTCQICSGKGSYVCHQCTGHGLYDCSICLRHGDVQCPQCIGYRFVRIWTRLHVKWYNIYSSMTHQSHMPCVLPRSIIEKTLDKITCLVYDNVWSSLNTSIDEVLNRCVGIPDELREKINDDYRDKHCKKVGEIVRLNCIIQRLKIKEIEYQFHDRKDEIFVFCLYGEDEMKVYDNQYPYRFFGFRCSSSSCLLI